MNILGSSIDFEQQFVNILLELFGPFGWLDWLVIEEICSFGKLHRSLANDHTFQARRNRIEDLGQCPGHSRPMQTAALKRCRMDFHQTEHDSVALIRKLHVNLLQALTIHQQEFGQIDFRLVKQIFQILQTHAPQQVEHIGHVRWSETIENQLTRKSI